MGADSKIEWTHHTFNPWRGCSKVSPGCAHCYAEAMSRRNPAVLGEWGDAGARVIAAEGYWHWPVLWNKNASELGERHRVFCASLADVFEDRPELVAPRARLFALIDATPHLDWLLLTKRPENIMRLTPWGHGTLASLQEYPAAVPSLAGGMVQRSNGERPNVWLGTSVENQAAADDRVEHLVRVPAAVRFLSIEPLLGPINLNWIGCEYQGADAFDGVIDALRGETWVEDWYDSEGKRRERRVTGACGKIHLVIVGGESGPHARPMHPDWARSLRDQCEAAGVAYFLKQWGEWLPKTEAATIGPSGWEIRPEWHEAIRRAPWGCLNVSGKYDPETTTWNGRQCDPQSGYEVTVFRVGKAAAGRRLDGREHNEMPNT